MEAQAWREDAACRGARPSIFYPDNEADERRAKAVCGLCSVRQRCLDFALASAEPDGIWGGLNSRQRRRLDRARRELRILASR